MTETWKRSPRITGEQNKTGETEEEKKTELLHIAICLEPNKYNQTC